MSRTEANRQLVRRLFEELWNGVSDAVLELVPETAVFHYGASTFHTGRDELAALIAEWRTGFPDLEFTIEELVAESDIVAARLTYRGTHLGPWRGLEPTGRRIEVDEMMFFRFEQGSLVELWELDDHPRRTSQLTDQ